MSNDSAQTILCYGDSNTWGHIPKTDNRYPRSVRWPGALQKLLGDEYEVISEGLCGRTLVAEDPDKRHRTGITHLQSILESADPIDWIVIVLGTNDAKTSYGLSAEQIAQHLEQTILFIKNPEIDLAKIPKIVVVCPPPVIVPESGVLEDRMVNAPDLFRSLPFLYREVAERNDCVFVNAGDHVSSSPIDGYHLDEGGHIKLAEVIRTIIVG
jgi:lysophospholipase L1-like esterase